MFDWLRELLRSYRETLVHDRRVPLEQFYLADFARKVVGVGSVGTRAWIALMLGNDGQDPLFMQAIVEFSHAYAEQNERDYRELVVAVESGRITAETGL